MDLGRDVGRLCGDVQRLRGGTHLGVSAELVLLSPWEAICMRWGHPDSLLQGRGPWCAPIRVGGDGLIWGMNNDNQRAFH